MYQAPRVTFWLYNNPVKMARSLKKLLNWVMSLLATRAQVFVTNLDNHGYRRQIIAEGGFFTVRVTSEFHPKGGVLLLVAARQCDEFVCVILNQIF
jgi:hypothetical protein